MMTFEEAKDVFLNRGWMPVENGVIFDGNKWRESVQVISRWLEQESCSDCISRSSIKQKLQDHHDFFTKAYGGFSNLPQNDKSRVDEIIDCIAMVVNEPPVTSQPDTAYWIMSEVRQSKTLICSKCRIDLGSICPTNYCPSCGRKMEKVEE